jgi:hypothetical protein
MHMIYHNEKKLKGPRAFAQGPLMFLSGFVCPIQGKESSLIQIQLFLSTIRLDVGFLESKRSKGILGVLLALVKRERLDLVPSNDDSIGLRRVDDNPLIHRKNLKDALAHFLLSSPIGTQPSVNGWVQITTIPTLSQYAEKQKRSK